MNTFNILVNKEDNFVTLASKKLFNVYDDVFFLDELRLPCTVYTHDLLENVDFGSYIALSDSFRYENNSIAVDLERYDLEISRLRAIAIEKIRPLRNELLSSTDWMVTAYIEVLGFVPDSLKTYRQYLRDSTNLLTADNNFTITLEQPPRFLLPVAIPVLTEGTQEF